MRRQRLKPEGFSLPVPLLLLFVVLVLPGLEELQAEIAYAPLASNRIGSDGESQETPVGCAQSEAYEKLLHSIDDVEDLDVDVPVHIALEQRQKKR